MVTMTAVPAVTAMAVVAGVSVVPTMPAVVAGVFAVPMVRGRVVARRGQRVGDTHAVSGYRLPVRGLILSRPARLTVS